MGEVMDLATRKDIAENAGVSVSVVSRALNNSGYVDAHKREIILEAARELGYRQNPIAVSLATKRTGQILFFCKDLKNAFNVELYEGMIETARKNNYMVVLSGEIDFSRIRTLMVDGVIFPNEVHTQEYLNNEGKNFLFPVVTASYGGGYSFARAVPRINCDLYKGMMEELRYLQNRGHRKIAFACPYLPKSAFGLDARISGWLDFFGTAGKELDRYYICVSRYALPDDPRALRFNEEQLLEDGRKVFLAEDFFSKGRFAAQLFCERKCDATAVVCFNDEMAQGFCRQLRENGLEVPEDVSVAGFDDTYANRYAVRRPTTLALNPKLQGQKCVEVLLDVINGRRVKNTTEIPFRLVEGETVKDLRKQ